ncbi:Bardet-Biedl syndrome 10 protein isoform X2 [Sphaerodactylus townsendi]|uniref:Bardet-Biedl syndrome 10 protein isoform X2 n=2 Tax=Sphaerodactylus townsendi TaxID=933632 RepID=UPI0020263967|nr:Bardet-Biedl syndrome 10 protein isoform X2 [Sphaerodactylus townsendi]
MVRPALLWNRRAGRMMIACISTHCNLIGDGAKTFIILLSALLQGLETLIERDSSVFCEHVHGREKQKGKCYGLNQVSRFLVTFQTHILDFIMTQDLGRHFTSVFSADDVDINRSTVESVLEAYFCGKVGNNWQKFLSQLSCDFYYKATAGKNTTEVLHFVDECFAELHIAVMGLPVSCSRILEGLVLQRDFAVYCPSEGEKRILIVTEPIHAALSDLSVETVITGEPQYQASELWIAKRTETIIRHMQHNNIKVLLSSVKQQEVVHYCAQRCGISTVECLSQEEISLICSITRISPFRPSQDNIHTAITEAAFAKFCQPLHLGGKRCIHINLTGTHAFHPHCVILCGPVRGVTEQHACAFYGAFKMLRQMFTVVHLTECHEPKSESQNSLNSQWGCAEQHQFMEGPTDSDNIQANDKQLIPCGVEMEKCSVVPTPVGAKQLAGSQTDACKSSCVTPPCADLEHNIMYSVLSVSQNGVVDLQKLSLQYNHPDKTGACENELSENQCVHATVEESASCRHALMQLQANKDSYTGPNCGVSVKDGGNKKSCIQGNTSFSIKAGDVVPAGGIFEILLHYYLSCYAKQCQSTSVSILCSLIADALLSIPKTLCKTLGKNAFARVYLEVIGALKNKRQPLLTSQQSLESVSCKYHLMASVLQCAARLLNIDLIVSIKQLPQKAVGSDSEDDQ